MTIAPNRLVAVLTPLVFAPPAGAVSVLIAEHMPAVGQLEALESIGR